MAVIIVWAFGLSNAACREAGSALSITGTTISFGFFVLDAPDAAEVVVAVGADGGVGGAVVGAAGVVVDDGLVVEIEEVEGTVRADAGFDGAEPEVAAADEFGFFRGLPRGGRCRRRRLFSGSSG